MSGSTYMLSNGLSHGTGATAFSASVTKNPGVTTYNTTMGATAMMTAVGNTTICKLLLRY